MPWRAVSTEALRQEFLTLNAQGAVSFRELCRRFGISRKTGYKWRARAAAGAALTDRARRPQRSPRRTGPAVEAAVVGLRHAHPAWGARKLRRRLQDQGAAVPAASTLTRILHRHGLIAAAAAGPRAWQRFEHPVPNALWQMDFKGAVPTLAGPAHPLTVLDDHSRFNLCLRVLPDQQTAGVQGALTATFRTYGLPDRLLVDNGSPWGSDAAHPWTPLTVWCLRVGVGVSHSRPYHPQTLGKEERFHETLDVEVLTGTQWRDRAHLQGRLDRWRPVYNLERPHEALGLAVPASRYRPSLRPFPETLPPIAYAPGVPVRKVQQGGHFTFQGRACKVGKAFAGYPVALRPTLTDGVYEVVFCAHVVAELNFTTGP